MNKNVIGYLLGFIAGIVATIPWFVIYYYGGWLIALLALPIALASLWVFRKVGGTITKATPYIIALETLLCLTIVMFLIVPLFALTESNLPLTIDSLNMYIYGNSNYFNAILSDSVITYIFGIIGIAGVFSNLRREANPEIARKYEDKINKIQEHFLDEKDEIYQLFLKADAFSKENTIGEDELLEIFNNKNHKRLFNNMRSAGIIRKSDGRYYYIEKNEKYLINGVNTNPKTFLIIFITITILILLIALLP